MMKPCQKSKLLSIDDLVRETGAYDTDSAEYISYRTKLAEAIVRLKALVEKTGAGGAD